MEKVICVYTAHHPIALNKFGYLETFLKDETRNFRFDVETSSGVVYNADEWHVRNLAVTGNLMNCMYSKIDNCWYIFIFDKSLESVLNCFEIFHFSHDIGLILFRLKRWVDDCEPFDSLFSKFILKVGFDELRCTCLKWRLVMGI